MLSNKVFAMNRLLFVLNQAWEPVLVTLLVLSGIFGLIAVVSPSTFRALATGASQWVDASKALAFLDRRVDLDKYILPRSRLLGVAVLAAVGVLAIRLYVW